MVSSYFLFILNVHFIVANNFVCIMQDYNVKPKIWAMLFCFVASETLFLM